MCCLRNQCLTSADNINHLYQRVYKSFMMCHLLSERRELMRERKSAQTVTPDELRELAEAMGCHTQKDLAEALGITQARVSQILSGKHPVKPGALLTLIRQLQAQYLHGKRRRTESR